MTVEPAAAPSLATAAASAFADYVGGQSSRMADLVEAVTPILWHTARAQGLSHDSAQDAVQNAWLQLVTHATSIKDPQAVLGWLITTVRRDAWRLTKAAGREVGEVPAEVVDVAPGPAHSVLARADNAMLWRHFRELTPRCQALLRVVAFADRPDYAAVSTALGMPVGSIGPTRGRCLAKLRELLVDDPEWGGIQP